MGRSMKKCFRGKWARSARGRSCRAIFSLAAGFVCLLFGETVSADNLQTATLTFVVTGATGPCPDEESFRNQVAARLGYQPFVQGGEHHVSVTLRAVRDRVHGRAEVLRSGQAKPGVRELDGKTVKCDSLVAALATTVAIAIDPVKSEQPVTVAAPLAASDRPLPPEKPPPSPPPQPHAPPQVPASSHSLPVVIFGTAGARAAVGLTPGLAVGGGVGVGLRRGVLSLEVSGQVETTPKATRANSGDRLEATVFSAMLSPCGHWGSWLACAAVRLGVFQGRAPDVVHPSLGTSLAMALGARGGYILPISSALALRGLLSAEFPLVRTSLAIDNVSVWTSPPLSASLELGVVVTVP